MQQGYAVVDFETTGLSPARGDRAIEIGLVHVTPDGTLEDEHETLIHVNRDIGASWVHRITARELLHAPDFEGIAHELRDLLAGRVFVAHNVAFDSKFLLAEYARLGARIPVGQRTMLCTMKLSRALLGRGKLADCCEYFGIANNDAHSALSDAHATAILLGRLMQADPKWSGWNHRLTAAAEAVERWPTFAALPEAEWMPRGTHADGSWKQAASGASGVRRGDAGNAADASHDERGGHGAAHGVSIHDGRHAVTRATAARNTVRNGMSGNGAALGDPDGGEDAFNPPLPAGFRLRAGDAIVLTGSMRERRSEVEARLTSLGLDVRPSVTKRVRLVVAADPYSQSTKARKARDYGIPIVSERRFRVILEKGIEH